MSKKYPKSIQKELQSIQKDFLKYLKSIRKVFQNYPKSIPRVSQKYPKVSQKDSKSIPKVSQNCTMRLDQLWYCTVSGLNCAVLNTLCSVLRRETVMALGSYGGITLLYSVGNCTLINSKYVYFVVVI